MDVLRNNEGQEVLPLSAYNPVEPKQGVIFDDELYTQLQSGSPEPAPVQAALADPVPASEPSGPVAEPVAETTQEPQPATPTVDYDSFVKEKTAGKFEKFDDLLNALEKPKTAASSIADVQFENEQSKQIFEYLQAGKIEEVTSFLQQQAIIDGVDKMAPTDLLKMKIQMTYPDMAPDEIEEEYQDELSKYGFDKIDEDIMTEAEIAKVRRKAERKLHQEMNAFKQEVKSLKAELKLPELSSPEQPKNELADLVESFSKEAGQYIPNLKEITIKAQVDKDATIDHGFVLTEEDKAELANVSKDYWADFKNRYYKEGKYDSQSLARDVFIRNNFDKILNSAMAKAYMQGRLGVVMNVSNATNGTAPSAASVDVTGDAVRESLRKFILT